MRTSRAFLVVVTAVTALVLALTGTALASPAHSANTAGASDPNFFQHLTTSFVSAYPLPTDTKQCFQETDILTGMYTFGQHYSDYGDSYDRDGIWISGFYEWTDCLVPTEAGWVQVSILHPRTARDTTRDITIQSKPRDVSYINGNLTWGSFLINDTL